MIGFNRRTSYTLFKWVALNVFFFVTEGDKQFFERNVYPSSHHLNHPVENWVAFLSKVVAQWLRAEGFGCSALPDRYLCRHAALLSISPGGALRRDDLGSLYNMWYNYIVSILFSFVSVFDILLKFHETEDWRVALETCIPPRKGLVVKQP